MMAMQYEGEDRMMLAGFIQPQNPSESQTDKTTLKLAYGYSAT